MRYYSDVKPNDMKNRIFFLLLFFVCLEWNAYAVIDIQSIHITSSDGLANNTIRDIFQDKKGFIWISTTNGLSRYDGHSFITLLPEKDSPISLADYHVKKIDEDKNGFLWVLSTSNVFSCYDLRHNCFVDFTGCGEHDQAYAYRVETANGDNWLWDGQKGCRKISFENEHFSSVTFQCENGKLPSNKVNSLIEDSRGNVWICTQEGLVKVTRNKIEVISDMHNFRAAFSYENACFFLADNGDIYVYDEDEKLHFVQRIGKDDVDFHFTTHFGTKDDWWLFTTKGSYRFHLSTRQVRLDNPINIPNARFVRDNQGDFYVFNQTGVLHYFQKETGICKILSLIDAAQMMPAAEERYEVIQDNRGLIWISTFGYGLFVYNPQEDIISHYTYQETGKNLVHSNFLHSLLLDHSGNVWVGSEFAGVTLLSVLSEGSYRIYPEHESINDYVNAIRTVVKMPDGGFWFGTRQGNVYAYDKNLEAASCYKMPYNYIYADLLAELNYKRFMFKKLCILLIFSKLNEIKHLIDKYRMHNLYAIFAKLLNICKQIAGNLVNESGNVPRRGVVPKFSDLEVVALNMASEAVGIDSESLLFANLQEYRVEIPNLISRRQYNDRRKITSSLCNAIRERMVAKMDGGEDYFCIDSKPIEVCRIARSKRCSMGKKDFSKAPGVGYCASQSMYYYGYKLHAVCGLSGVIHSFDLTKASVHDIHYLKDVKVDYSNCTVIGDRGYISAQVQLDLFETANIRLEVPYRCNQKEWKPTFPAFAKARKRIETLFSQLCDQFMIIRNYAKDTDGLFARIIGKISALTILQYINYKNEKPIGRVKYALF